MMPASTASLEGADSPEGIEPPDEAADDSGVEPSARAARGAFLVILAALTAGVLSLVFGDESAIGPYGLISALPPVYFAAVFAVLATLLYMLRWRREHTLLLAFGTIALVVLVHGSAALVESQARFATAWLHAGFVNSIMTLGEPTPSFDARMSWPGFFTGAGALTGNSGLGVDPVPLLRWAPMVLFACYVPSLLAIGKATLPGWRAPWLGVMVFIFANWVGQDYFAPQTVAYILYLAMVALVLTYLRKCDPGKISAFLTRRSADPPWLFKWLGSMIRAGRREIEPAQRPAGRALIISLILLFGALTVAMVSSHQLTPVVLGVLLGALMVMGRLRAWPLTAVVFVVTLGWLSYGAVAFWTGHLDDIFGGFGQIGSVVDSGVADRIVGSPEHLQVLSIRIYFVMTIFGLAALGAVRLWWSGNRVSVVLLLLMGVPGFLIATQSYGGEGLLRVVYFALVGASFLIASLILPLPRAPRGRVLIAAGLAFCLLFPVFLVARWGNEISESNTTADLQIAQATYDLAPLGSTIGSLAQGGPAAWQDLTLYRGVSLQDGNPFTNVEQVNKLLGENPIGVFIRIAQPQINYLVQNMSVPADYGTTFTEMMVASGQYRIVYQNSSGVVLQRIPKMPAVTGPSAGREATDQVAP